MNNSACWTTWCGILWWEVEQFVYDLAHWPCLRYSWSSHQQSQETCREVWYRVGPANCYSQGKIFHIILKNISHHSQKYFASSSKIFSNCCEPGGCNVARSELSAQNDLSLLYQCSSRSLRSRYHWKVSFCPY